MISDRSQKEEPLIPAERIKIRLEMALTRRSSECKSQGTCAGKCIRNANALEGKPSKDTKTARRVLSMTPSEEKADYSKDETSDAKMVTVFGQQSTGA